MNGAKFQNNTGKLTNKMVFGVLTKILEDTIKSTNGAQNLNQENLNKYIKSAKEHKFDMDKIHEIKKKLIDNHLLLDDENLENMFALLNCVNENSIKNETTISVIIETITKGIETSITKQFNPLVNFEESIKPFMNSKSPKTIEMFKKAVEMKYRLREIVIYVIFPMVTHSFITESSIPKEKIDMLEKKAIANGFNPKNLIKLKSELELVGHGSQLRTLHEKIKYNNFLNKLGGTIDIEEDDDIGYGKGGNAKNVLKNVSKFKNIAENVLKQGNNIMNLAGTVAEPGENKSSASVQPTDKKPLSLKPKNTKTNDILKTADGLMNSFQHKTNEPEDSNKSKNGKSFLENIGDQLNNRLQEKKRGGY